MAPISVHSLILIPSLFPYSLVSRFLVVRLRATHYITHMKLLGLVVWSHWTFWLCAVGSLSDSFLYRLRELGANELCSRVDVDQEDWEAIGLWVEAVRAGVVALELATGADYLDLSQQAEDTGYSRTQPFWARISVREGHMDTAHTHTHTHAYTRAHKHTDMHTCSCTQMHVCARTLCIQAQTCTRCTCFLAFHFTLHPLQDKRMLTSMNSEKDKETIHVEVDISGKYHFPE